MTYAPDIDLGIAPALEARRGRAAVPAAVWKLARQDYADGWSASEVCDRHDIKPGTFKHRARHEGWRRADQPAPETPVPPRPIPLPGVLHDDSYLKAFADVSGLAMAEIARRNLAEALFKGQLTAASRWLRLAQAIEADHKHREGLEAHHAIFSQFMKMPPLPGSPLPQPAAPDPETDEHTRLDAALAADPLADLWDPETSDWRDTPGQYDGDEDEGDDWPDDDWQDDDWSDDDGQASEGLDDGATAPASDASDCSDPLHPESEPACRPVVDAAAPVDRQPPGSDSSDASDPFFPPSEPAPGPRARHNADGSLKATP